MSLWSWHEKHQTADCTNGFFRPSMLYFSLFPTGICDGLAQSHSCLRNCNNNPHSNMGPGLCQSLFLGFLSAQPALQLPLFYSLTCKQIEPCWPNQGIMLFIIFEKGREKYNTSSHLLAIVKFLFFHMIGIS